MVGCTLVRLSPGPPSRSLGSKDGRASLIAPIEDSRTRPKEPGRSCPADADTPREWYGPPGNGGSGGGPPFLASAERSAGGRKAA